MSGWDLPRDCLRTCFEMRFGVTDELYDGPPSPSKPVGETKSDGFGEPSYDLQNTFLETIARSPRYCPFRINSKNVCPGLDNSEPGRSLLSAFLISRGSSVSA